MDSSTRQFNPQDVRQLEGALATVATHGPLTQGPYTRSTLGAPRRLDLEQAVEVLRRNSNLIAPALIGLGLLLYLIHPNYAHVVGASVPLVMGLGFLYVYLQQGRHFGLLVPGALLTGLGLGSLAAVFTGMAGLIAVGLGLGFCAIWYAVRAHWWALIPGVFLALVGAAVVAANSATYAWALPLLLVVTGLVLLVRRWTTPSRS